MKKVLKPGGIFVTYNFFRQGWVVERVVAMAERVFGCKPLVISLPYQEKLSSSEPAGFTIIIAGCNQRVAEALAADKNFWLNTLAARNQEVNGFAVQPQGNRLNAFMPPSRRIGEKFRRERRGLV